MCFLWMTAALSGPIAATLSDKLLRLSTASAVDGDPVITISFLRFLLIHSLH